jgi:hypothetical protein
MPAEPNAKLPELPALREETLAAAHTLQIQRSPEADDLRILAPGGTLSLSIRVSEQGVELLLAGASLVLRSTGEISLDAEVIRMRGRSGIEIDGGTSLALRAEEQRVVATRGNVDIEASDDVALDGERILLNCPIPSP